MDRQTISELNEMNSEAIDLVSKEFSINRVLSNEEGEYTGEVHDLLVNDTHNYEVEGLGVVHNGGKRKGAAAIYLETHHPDIMEFLELRDNVGEKEKRAYNLNLANWIPDEFMRRVRDNADWSLFDPVVAPELTDLYGDEYTARYKQLEAEGKAHATVSAQKVWARMMKTLAETGNGWVCFKDVANERCNTAVEIPETIHVRTQKCVLVYDELDTVVTTANRGEVVITDLLDTDTLVLDGENLTIINVIRRPMQKHVVHLSNLCTEIIETTNPGTIVELTREELNKLEPDDFVRHSIELKGYNPETNKVRVLMGAETAVCNLGSINISKGYLTKNGKLDVAKLHKNVDMAVRYLDRVIDRNFYPIPSARASNDRLRPIGLGLMGLQDLFFQMRLPFDSKEAIEVGAQVQEEIYYQALKTSVELAKENGPHRDFKYTKAAKGLLQFDLAGVVPKDVARWDALKEEIKTHGLRNSLLIAVAPTATIANIVGASECIEPTKENLMKRETLSGEFISINSYLVEDLKKVGRWNEETIAHLKKNDGSIQQLVGLPTDYYSLYKTVWEMSQKVLIDHAIARGAYIDQAQSLNLFIDLNKYDEKRRIAVLSSMYMYAWNNGKGVKTTYYLRGKPASKISQTDSVSGVNVKAQADEVCESCT